MTDLDNLVALCGKHHHAYHRGEFTMTGNANIPGAAAFLQRPRPTNPQRAPPNPPQPAHHPHPTSPYTHPTGEHLNTLWLNLTPN